MQIRRGHGTTQMEGKVPETEPASLQEGEVWIKHGVILVANIEGIRSIQD